MMTRRPIGRSLHLGLNEVDPGHYGAKYPLSGCHHDARGLASIARGAGLEARILLDAAATSDGLLGELAASQRDLRAGDTFLITYAGHGSQLPDETGDEGDGLDETWVLFDRMFLDDELYQALAGFREGVRILLVSDSCHSGTIARKMQTAQALRESGFDRAGETRFRTPEDADFGEQVFARNREIYRAVRSSTPTGARDGVVASVIQISACQDDQLAADGDANGLFTSKLVQVWGAGSFRGDHRALYREISKIMPAAQTPNYLTFGRDVASFEVARPFGILEESQSIRLDHDKENQEIMSLDNTNRLWREVRAELQRVVPGWNPPCPNGTNGRIETASAPSMVTTYDGGASAVGASPRAPTGAPIVRAFWWGFHIECSSQGLRDFMAVADPVNAMAAAIGPVTGPAAPFVMAAAAFVAASFQLLKGLDRGAGVYISMSWFAPGIFIPTTVPADRGALGPASRGGEYEQAGAPWYRDYGGGLFGLRLEEDIYWNLPTGTVRVRPIVNINPPSFGNIYFNGWLSDDPTVGHFRLHVGVAAFQGGRVEVRMMIRDDPGPRLIVPASAGPRALAANEL